MSQPLVLTIIFDLFVIILLVKFLCTQINLNVCLRKIIRQARTHIKLRLNTEGK
jgi:hypothetical protein